MMKNNYKIAHHGLKEGTHRFIFIIDNKFFEYFNYPDILGGQVEVNLALEKKTRHMELYFEYRGKVVVSCDICLEPMDFPLKLEDDLFVKMGEDESQDSDVMIISPNQPEIDLSQYLFDTISVSLPYKKSHETDMNSKRTCNPEMLKKLEQYSTEKKQEKPVDSRWDKLKNINFN